MKIMHLIDSQGIYGAEKVLLTLATTQKKDGHHPIIVSTGVTSDKTKPIDDIAKSLDLDVIDFQMKSGFDPLGTLKLNRLAKQLHVDIIHSHGYKFNVQYGFLPRFVRACPVISTVHGYTDSPRYSKKWFYKKLDLLSLRKLDHVVLVSNNMLSFQGIKNIHSSRRTVVANGIDIEDFINRMKPKNALQNFIPDFANFGTNKTIIGTFGRLAPEKGFHILLDAFSQLIKEKKDVRLIILGEGPERANLETIIKNEKMESFVRMPGYVEDAGTYCSAFHIFALPSYTEGLPISVLEAIITGSKIVASDVGGVADVLDHGKIGKLIPAGEPNALYQALMETLQGDPKQNDDYLSNWKLRFSNSQMHQNYMSIMKNVIDQFTNMQ